MKIASIKLHPVSVPRRYATVIAKKGGEANRAVERSSFIFVEATADNGLVGWGEVSDIPPEDYPNLGEYEKLLTDIMVGRNPFAIQQLHMDLSEHLPQTEGSLTRYTSCALDMAMYDLAGQFVKRPVSDLLGGGVRRDVRISWVAYIRDELGLLREEIREKVNQGFDAFKVKVGVDIDLDEARVGVVREVAGPRASIKVDANAGWSVANAPKNIRRLNKFNLAGVETPVPRENPADIAAVRKQVDVPILEHVNDVEYAMALLKAEAVDEFNIATTNCGGLWPARQVAALAQGAGVGVLLGSTVEMGPGTLAQLHLAALTPNLTLPSDLIGPGMYVSDVLEKPLVYHKGKLNVPTGPGLGGTIDREKLAKLGR